MQFLSSHNHEHNKRKESTRKLYVYGLTSVCGIILVGLWVWSLNSDAFNVTRTSLEAFAPDSERSGEVREAFEVLVNPQEISQEFQNLKEQRQRATEEQVEDIENIDNQENIAESESGERENGMDSNGEIIDQLNQNEEENNGINQLLNESAELEQQDVILEGLDVDNLFTE